MTSVQAETSANTSESPKTICFGRFLVDLPEQAEANFSDATYKFGNIHSEKVDLTPTQFHEKMKKREAEIKLGQNTDDYEYVRTQFDQKRPDTWIFLSSLDVFGHKVFRVEFYALRKNVLFSMIGSPYSADKVETALQEITNQLLPSLEAREPSVIPANAGFCFRDGFFNNDGNEKQLESLTVAIRFKKWPDLRVSLTTDTIQKKEPSLLERMKSASVPDILVSVIGLIRTVRAGKHDVGPITGEESLNTVPTDHGYRIHQFRWESHFELNAPRKPMLALEIETGYGPKGSMKPTISDEEAVKLFDAIVNSIRPRPTQAPSTSQIDPAPLGPTTALGDLQATGRACPQTGWWQTSERGEIEGGAKRLFRQGEVFPAVKLLGEANVWQKLKGERPAYQTNTVWQLVAYEATDKPQNASGKSEQPPENNSSSPSVS